MDDSCPARRRSIRGIHDTYRNRWHAAGYPRPLAIVRKETVMMNLFAVLTNTGFHLAGWRHPSAWTDRSAEHTSELQSLMRISYAVFCLHKKKSDILDSKRDPFNTKI